MWPLAIPIRLVPTREPSPLRAGLTAAVLLAIAAGLGVLAMGPGGAPTEIYYPALILVTLYADAAWGALSLGVSTFFIWWMWTRSGPLDGRHEGVLFLYSACGFLAILVCAALRSTVVQLRSTLDAQLAAEAALARSQASLRLAQEAGGVGFWDWDLVTGAGFWSPSVYRTLGLDPSESPSTDRLIELTHPDDRDEVRRMTLSALSERRMESPEYRIIRPDGQVRWLLSRGETLRDENGRPLRSVGVHIDITDRREAMETLRESEARFRTLADSAPAPMWVTRADGEREFANAAYVEFLGIPYDQAVAYDWQDLLHPDDAEQVAREQQAAEAAHMPYMHEARFRRPDGDWRWIRSFAKPRFGPGGAFGGYIGIAFDVTDVKQAEGDLLRINDLLHERVAAVLEERDHAQAALAQSQRLEAVGRLTGGVAHDFNNLLTIIIGALDILERHPADAQRRQRLIEAANAAARRGERLNQQLLAFSRRQPLRPEIAEVDAVLREAEPILRRAVGENVRLDFILDAPGACARLGVAQFEAAVLNLVVNAHDAIGPQGVIKVSTARETLKTAVGETPPGEYLRVAVQDTGPGMAPEVLSQAFEPFFTTKAVGKGAGLGLSQVYGFARQSGGVARIESRPEEGAVVSLLLPLMAGIPEPRAVANDLETGRGRALNVLLVEDDLQVGDLVSAMLAELGHHVLRASSSDAALDSLSDHPEIGLVLTDVMMPGERNGLDLAREISRTRPILPVVLMSGYIGEAIGLAEDAPWPMLKKPFPLDVLASTLAAAVG